ncbi:MAG: ATP-binding cassette domain-containing protein [Nitriliruptorales bacterium]|nr:ATP-binding cassette domain-containing protein [Nitriliruptorales bacterium]
MTGPRSASAASALPGDGVPAVSARAVVKRYGDFHAVDHVNLEVLSGGCFGVLGPNGAGKTTLMRMICCVSPLDGGRLEVLGADVRGDRRALKRRLGVVPQGQTLDDALTVRENLTTFATYHDVPRTVAGERADGLLEFAQLAARADDRTDQLSGGMQRRLLIARALVNDPELVVLDEPTTGLDPQARQLVWQRLRMLVAGGKTLLLTTHYMEEAAQLCDQLVVMDQGRIIAEGSPRELIEATVPPRAVEVLGADGLTDAVRHTLGDLAADIDGVGNRLLVATADSDQVLAGLREARLEGRGLLVRDATLEDVFLRLTGRALIE